MYIFGIKISPLTSPPTDHTKCIIKFLVGGWTTHLKNMSVKLDQFPDFKGTCF